MSKNLQKPSEKQGEFQTKGAARPEGSDELEKGQFCNADFNVIATKHGWTMGTYTNNDGTSGYILTNGMSIFHFDTAGNIILSTGKPAQAGCGGKVVIRAEDKQEKAKTTSIHITGNDDQKTRTKDEEGGEKVEEYPPYSLFVEGDIAIESQGGEVSIKADNITLNSANVLTLRAGEAINLEAGEGGGKVNVLAGDYNINAAFSNNTITGGHYIDNTGETTVNQIIPGTVTSVNTVGGVNYLVRGEYNVGILGDYNVAARGNILFGSLTGGIGVKTIGKSYEFVGSTKESIILGRPFGGIDSPTETFSQQIGGPAPVSYVLRATQQIVNKSISGWSLLTKGPVSLTGSVVTIKGASIFLN
ncbi:MAG: hypothetical protein ACO21H_02725 [Sediminibacterium sp.]